MSHMRSRATRWFLTLVAAVVPAVGFALLQVAPAAAVVCGTIAVEGQVISCTPSAQLIINDTSVDLSRSIMGAPKSFQLTLGPIDIEALARVSLSVSSNADPFVAYGIAVTNLTAGTLDADFTFTQSFVGGPYTALFTSHSGSVTDSGSNPDGNVTIGARRDSFINRS